MACRALVPCLAVVTAAVVISSCGNRDTDTTVPTAEQMASTLVMVDDFDGEWTVNEFPDGSPTAPSGVVSDDGHDMLVKLDMCDEASAESIAAADSLRWQAFRQLDLTVDDPIELRVDDQIEPPDRTGHMAFVQELLNSGAPDEIETTFDLIRDGMQACLGDFAADQEGPGSSETMAIPDVGDDRFGVLVTVGEAGASGEWRLYNALIRQGPVLMLMVVYDIRAGEAVEPQFSIDDIGELIQAAVDKL
jgi:hypothetical protein